MMRVLPRRLGRVAQMTPAEISARVAMAVRRGAGRVVHASRTPAWHRRDLLGALAPDAPGVRDAAARLAAGDAAAAHDALSRHFVARRRRWPVAPGSRDALVAAIRARFPDAAVDATTRAQAIADGRFDLLGYRALSFGAPIDWHHDPVHARSAPRRFWTDVPYLSEACGDHKIIWELNRHQHWLALGRAHWLSADRLYAATFVDHLGGWMAANPPLIGINWASMLELGFRAISWIWALHLFVEDPPAAGTRPDRRAEPPWTVDLLLGLDRQLRLVEGNLSTWFSPNTHLLGEALALYVAGRALPELRRAEAWTRLGRRVLFDEIERQITADGGHAERSFHYHRYALDFYLLAFAVARLTGDDVAAFGEAAQRLARFTRIVADDRGRLARVGDDDGGQLFPMCGRDSADASDSLGVAAWLLQDPSLAVGPPPEEVLWMAGDEASAVSTPAGVPIAVRSASLEESGYTVCRSPRGDHLVFDAGPHGFLNGGHAHADALAIVLTIAGRPFLIDPGTASYTNREARDRFRSTRLHNTLTLDGRPQSTPSGPFHWATTAAATRGAWRPADEVDVVEGWHDGYAPVRHTRAIAAKRGCWIVDDRVDGPGPHRAEIHWHVDPAWTVELIDPAVARARHAAGGSVWIVSPDAPLERFTGSAVSPELGWHSPVYGAVAPCTTLRATREAPGPFAVRTVIVEGDDLPAEFRQRGG
jgi:heparinase II/III-like protein